MYNFARRERERLDDEQTTRRPQVLLQRQQFRVRLGETGWCQEGPQHLNTRRNTGTSSITHRQKNGSAPRIPAPLSPT